MEPAFKQPSKSGEEFAIVDFGDLSSSEVSAPKAEPVDIKIFPIVPNIGMTTREQLEILHRRQNTQSSTSETETNPTYTISYKNLKDQSLMIIVDAKLSNFEIQNTMFTSDSDGQVMKLLCKKKKATISSESGTSRVTCDRSSEHLHPRKNSEEIYELKVKLLENTEKKVLTSVQKKYLPGAVSINRFTFIYAEEFEQPRKSVERPYEPKIVI